MYSKIKTENQTNEISMFEKRTVLDLSEKEMTEIDGGTSYICFRITLLILTIS
jgi:hypothetical protein